MSIISTLSELSLNHATYSRPKDGVRGRHGFLNIDGERLPFLQFEGNVTFDYDPSQTQRSSKLCLNLSIDDMNVLHMIDKKFEQHGRNNNFKGTHHCIVVNKQDQYEPHAKLGFTENAKPDTMIKRGTNVRVLVAHKGYYESPSIGHGQYLKIVRWEVIDDNDSSNESTIPEFVK